MKRTILLLTALMFVAAGLFAQSKTAAQQSLDKLKQQKSVQPSQKLTEKDSAYFRKLTNEAKRNDATEDENSDRDIRLIQDKQGFHPPGFTDVIDVDHEIKH